MLLQKKFIDLLNFSIPEDGKPGQVVITGDAHASFGIWLIPLIQMGYLAISKNSPEMQRADYARLDELTQSTCLDQLHKALKELKTQEDKYNNSPKFPVDAIPLKINQQRVNLLKEVVTKELNDFSEIMGRVTCEKECKLVDMGDSTGDRGYCDLFMLETLYTLTSHTIQVISIVGNHNLESLVSLLNNDWNPDQIPVIMSRDYPSQIRSLTNFRTLVHCELISPEKLQILLGHWIEHLHLIAYSCSNENSPDTTVYTHAPSDFKTINELADKYSSSTVFKSTQQFETLNNSEHATLSFHHLMRQHFNLINTHFRKKFFNDLTNQDPKKLKKYTNDWCNGKNKQETARAINALPLYHLSKFVSSRAAPVNCPETLTFCHGHTLAYESSQLSTSNVYNLDNTYFKPGESYLTEYVFNSYENTPMDQLLHLHESEMLEGKMYYSFYSNNSVAFKGKTKKALVSASLLECDEDLLIDLLTPYYVYQTCDNVPKPRYSLRFLGLAPSIDVTFTDKHVFYYDENPEVRCMQVPICTLPLTTNFGRSFEPHPFNKDILSHFSEVEPIFTSAGLSI